jgi:regulator of protease activity HflC (stomatin/prohibitin superfamily)
MNANKSNLSPVKLFALIGCESILCLGILLFFAARELPVSIKPDERGLVTSLGTPTGTILEPGYHFLMPGQKVTIFDVSPQIYVMRSDPNSGDDSIKATTLDGQKIEVDLSVTYAVDTSKIVALYKQWRNGYEAGLVRPQSRGITRNVVTGYTFDEISAKNKQIEKAIFDQLAPELAENELTLVKVDVIDIRRAAQ